MVNLVTLHDPTCTAMEVDWGPFQTVLIVMVGFIHIASGATAFVAHFQIPINEQKQQPTTFIYIINFTISALFTLQSIPIMFHNYSPLFQSLQFVLHNIMVWHSLFITIYLFLKNHEILSVVLSLVTIFIISLYELYFVGQFCYFGNIYAVPPFYLYFLVISTVFYLILFFLSISISKFCTRETIIWLWFLLCWYSCGALGLSITIYSKFSYIGASLIITVSLVLTSAYFPLVVYLTMDYSLIDQYRSIRSINFRNWKNRIFESLRPRTTSYDDIEEDEVENPDSIYSSFILADNAKLTSAVDSIKEQIGRCKNLINPDDILQGSFIEKSISKGYYKNLNVAIKVNIIENYYYEKANPSLFREIVNLDALKDHEHENVIKYYGMYTTNIGTEGVSINIVMELMDQSVYDVITKTPSIINTEMIFDVLIQTCNGMVHLHSLNILHRDLKSQNILIGFDGTIKIADFGCSIQSKTKRNSVVGTKGYIAPEVASGMEYWKEADVYSFGYLIFELVNRRCVPLEDSGLRHYERKFPASLNTYELGLTQLAEKCWNYDPSSRPTFVEIFEYLSPLRKSLVGE